LANLVPIANVDLDVFEAWFGDFFDELFGPRQRRGIKEVDEGIGSSAL
jgi:hypothetical protein